jgi:hypothetical protein
MSRGAVLVGVVTSAIALALSTAGCSLILDFSPGSDADVGPANDGPDAGDPCELFEPNDALASPAQVAAGTYRLGICPAGDRDFLAFDLQANQDVTIQIDFVNEDSRGDLDMRLYAVIDSQVISVSEGFGEREMISHTAAGGDQLPAGSYVIEVFPFANTIQNDYTFEMTISDGPVPDAGPIDAMM